MSVVDIKSQIHLLVDNMDDIIRLRNVLSFISQEDDIFDELTKVQQNEILKTLDDYPKGNFHSNQQMKEQAKQWLMR